MTDPTRLSSSDIDELIRRFDQPDVVQALILTGSYARNEAGPHSDIDLVRFVVAGTQVTDDGTHLFHNRALITVSTYSPTEYERWFTAPHEATQWIAGIRVARVLLDRERFFTDGLQLRARNFVWDAAMQARANVDATRRMAGWCEEANKGLEGLRRGNDIGRLLNACHGLTWGLSEIIQIQRGVLVSSDNNAFHEIELALVGDERLIELRRMAFGLTSVGELRERVTAGLQLFALLAEQMDGVWQGSDAETVRYTAAQIRHSVPHLF